MSGRHPDERVSHPVSLQHWAATTMVHWRLPPRQVQERLPSGLDVDTFDGDAWVSLTPFRMQQARAPLVPALPWVSTYPECNVRTYVRGPDGRDGLWFFSLDVTPLPVVAVMRAGVGLPYMWSRMTIQEHGGLITYHLRRRRPFPVASSTLRVRPGPAIEAAHRSALDDWLTGRWRAYGRRGPRLFSVRVEHRPWPLHRAEVVDLEDQLLAAAGLAPPAEAAVVHACRGVHVRVSAPRLVADGSERGVPS